MILKEETVATEEAQATPAAPVDPLNSPEVNKAAHAFSQLVPQIKGRSRNLNGRAVSRVLTAMVEFPLGDMTAKLRSKEETELLMMCLHAQECKQIMTQAVLANQSTMKEIEQEVSDKMTQEILTKQGVR